MGSFFHPVVRGVNWLVEQLGPSDLVAGQPPMSRTAAG